jgi:hypothetical protein
MRWIAKWPVEYTAKAEIESDTKPSIDDFRLKAQQGKFERGLEYHLTLDMKIEGEEKEEE